MLRLDLGDLIPKAMERGAAKGVDVRQRTGGRKSMPGGDGTGPAGFGPRTGRALGYCAGYQAPGYATPGFGQYAPRGGGRGRGGGGRGIRKLAWAGAPIGYGVPNAFVPPAPTPAEELASLEDAAKNLEGELNRIKARIEALKSEE